MTWLNNGRLHTQITLCKLCVLLGNLSWTTFEGGTCPSPQDTPVRIVSAATQYDVLETINEDIFEYVRSPYIWIYMKIGPGDRKQSERYGKGHGQVAGRLVRVVTHSAVSANFPTAQ